MLSTLFLAGIALGIPLGFLGGSIFTRRIMAPSYCPRCLQHKEWLKDLKEDREKDSAEEKKNNRWYYHLRRRDKS